MLVNLTDILREARSSKKAIMGFNVFGYAWTKAIIQAAEDCARPVIILTNRDFVNYAPPRHIGPIFADLATRAAVPVCLHLDHNTDFKVIREALDAGYSSVMYDGSALALEQNIANTKEVLNWAKSRGASVEGEVGSVAYNDQADSVTEYSDPEEAQRYVSETRVDALAISVGTTHRSTSKSAKIQYDLLYDIAQRVQEPLVIHGTSSIHDADLLKMPEYGVAKYNAGTVLRQAYARTLRQVLKEDEQIFDKLQLSRKPLDAVYTTAKSLIQKLA